MTAITPSLFDSLFFTIPFLLTPAILLGMIWYIIKLMGKMIDDYAPYSDDRKYSAELNGLIFFSQNIVLPIIMATLIYLYFQKRIEEIPLTLKIWIPPIIVILINSIINTKNKFYSMLFFGQKEVAKKIHDNFSILDEFVNKWGTRTNNFLFKPIKRIKLIVIIISISIIISCLSKNILSITSTIIFSFFTILILPTVYAMNRFALLAANIETNQGIKYENCEIIKITNEFIRGRKNKIIFLVNKNDVKKLEILGDVNKIVK